MFYPKPFHWIFTKYFYNIHKYYFKRLELHQIQTKILERLMYNPKLKFSDLQLPSLTSKHFNYHLQELVKQELITKNEKFYYLTVKGKEHVGRLDEKKLLSEKQPKISVAIIVEKKFKGQKFYLLNKRLKQPYYGKVGGFTGKVKFGELFEQTARRELLEETGLTGDFDLRFIVRKRAYDKDKGKQAIIQDQIMIFFLVTNPKGNFVEETKESKNFWVEKHEVYKQKNLYNTFFDFFEKTLKNNMEDIEILVEAEGY